jgi:hypothetical protein
LAPRWQPGVYQRVWTNGPVRVFVSTPQQAGCPRKKWLVRDGFDESPMARGASVGNETYDGKLLAARNLRLAHCTRRLRRMRRRRHCDRWFGAIRTPTKPSVAFIIAFTEFAR